MFFYILIDATKSHHFNINAGFFFHFANDAILNRFSEFDDSTRKFPTSLWSFDKQDFSVFIKDDGTC